MAQDVQIKVMAYPKRNVVVMTIQLVPRGSGNRNLAKRVAEAVKNDPYMGRHVLKAIPGLSKVVVEFDASMEAMLDAWRMMLDRRRDVKGQKFLFPGVA